MSALLIIGLSVLPILAIAAAIIVGLVIERHPKETWKTDLTAASRTVFDRGGIPSPEDSVHVQTVPFEKLWQDQSSDGIVRGEMSSSVDRAQTVVRQSKQDRPAAKVKPKIMAMATRIAARIKASFEARQKASKKTTPKVTKEVLPEVAEAVRCVENLPVKAPRKSSARYYRPVRSHSSDNSTDQDLNEGQNQRTVA